MNARARAIRVVLICYPYIFALSRDFEKYQTKGIIIIKVF